MLKNFKFTDFTSKKSYCRLQEFFASADYRNGFYEKLNEPFADRTIIINDVNFEGEENYREVSFIEGFIKPNIDIMHKFYFRSFIGEINSKLLLLKEQKSGLAKKNIQNIRVTNELLNKSEYLHPEVINVLSRQLELLEKKIEGFLLNPYPHVKTKIQFNWNRTDVIYFFHLLRENKQIEDISNADLGRVIDHMCEWSKVDMALAIKDSKKHLSDFKTTSGRSETPALKRLSVVFNDDFFNV
ncbi:hypothetical protein [Olleya sp. 1-3]|uniref:hypothetical protein n=1 Tax=Olleya sp. 1-3 TaxID=2058323 RepID=UPI000C32434B|nr:hypothetical protein [Olleya sp. 1-3]PKG52919.1 hypothetical protein CXF54_03860 [Olleya sp. 1-3]